MITFRALLSLDDTSTRFDKAVADAFKDQDISRGQVQKAIKAGQLKDEDNKAVTSWHDVDLEEFDVLLHLAIEAPNLDHIEPEDIPLNIVFEDDDILVINKQAGLVVHPGAGNHNGTLVNGLMHYLGQDIADVGDETRPGLVHRLDKDTSGLMVVAKTETARLSLTRQLEARDVTRIYTALVWGVPPLPQMSFDGPIGRHPKDRIKMAVTGKGRDALTHITRKAVIMNSEMSWLDCQLATGRTHQIRVHLSHAGFPIIGDQTYYIPLTSVKARIKRMTTDEGIRDLVLNTKRQMLHARQLSFVHPKTQEIVSFEAELPKDILELKEKLSKNI